MPLSQEQELNALLRHRRQLNHAPYLDIHLVDHCNLNCAGCLHYAPVAQKRTLDLDALEQDLAALSRVPGIDDGYFVAVLLMGGEPLLHPQVAQAARIARRYFVTTPVGISTNGLLLKRMSEEFWETCREHDVNLLLSPYPIDIDYDALVALALDKGVKATLNGDVTGSDRGKQVSWRLALDETGSQNPARSFALCQLDFTMQLRDGRIYPCNCGAYRQALNHAFGTRFEHDPADYIELGALNSTAQLDELRSNPLSMCAYCDWDGARVVEWGRSHMAREEWLAPVS